MNFTPRFRHFAFAALLAWISSLWAEPVKTHPRLLFTADDLPALRARMSPGHDVWVAFQSNIVDCALRDWKCSATSSYVLNNNGTPNNPADDYSQWVRTSSPMKMAVLHQPSDADWNKWSNQSERPADIPWTMIGAGSTVYLHHRAEPYRTKLLLSNRGTPEAWIRVVGLRGPNGERPVLDGQNATVAPTCPPYASGTDLEDQSLIAIARDATQPAAFKPGYIELSGLELRHAAPAFPYTRKNGAADTYSTLSGALHLLGAEHIRMLDCEVHHNASGLVSNEGGATEASLVRDVLVEACHFHDHSAPGQYYGHNIRLHAAGATVQGCRLDAPLSGANVANLRLISSGGLIRANFIDGGGSQLELTEAYGTCPCSPLSQTSATSA